MRSILEVLKLVRIAIPAPSRRLAFRGHCEIDSISNHPPRCALKAPINTITLPAVDLVQYSVIVLVHIPVFLQVACRADTRICGQRVPIGNNAPANFIAIGEGCCFSLAFLSPRRSQPSDSPDPGVPSHRIFIPFATSI